MVLRMCGPDFRILGPLEAYANGRPEPVPAARQRALLAVLLLEANRYVARDRLIDLLWHAAPPPGAVKTLQSYVSRLRTALDLAPGSAGPALEVGPDGRSYRLVVDDEAIDAQRFERLVEASRAAFGQGDHRQASAQAEAALALWRGRPLSDLTGYAFADQAARDLEAGHASALEISFRAAAELGALPSTAVSEAVEQYPDRVELRALLMRALYQAGRDVEALEACRRHRRDRRDLGVDPDPSLADLEGRILRRDPALDAPIVDPGFVGRTGPMGQLRRALREARAGHGRLVLLHGPAGIGKTTLAGRLVAEASRQGAVVATGSPHGTAGPRGFQPWVQVLEALGARTDTPADDPLARLLDQWRSSGPTSTQSEVTGDREQQFQTVVTALHAASDDGVVALLLDDVHEADGASLRLLLHLTRLLPGRRLLILAAHRDPPDERVAASLADLRRLVGVEDIELGVLTDRETADLIGVELGRAAPHDLVSEVTGRASGNPLFVVELTRLLGDEAALGRVRAGAQLPHVPERISATVLDRAGHLDPWTRDLLDGASVIGLEVEKGLLRAASGPADDLETLLRTAIDQRFLAEVADDPGLLHFTHPLVQQALYEHLPASARAAWHKRVATAIERRRPDAGRLDAERLAFHHRRAGHRSAGLRYTIAAAGQALATQAYEEAMRLVDVALDEPLLEPQRCELLLTKGRASARAGQPEVARRSLADAARLASRCQEPDRLVEAIASLTERAVWGGVARPDLVPLISDAVETIGASPGPQRVRLLSGLAIAQDELRSTLDSVTLSHRQDLLSAEAVQLARQLDEPALLAQAIVTRLRVTWAPDETARRDLVDELIGLAGRLGAPELALEGRHHRVVNGLELGEMELVRAEIAAYAGRAEDLRQPYHRYWAAVLTGTLALAEGRYAQAEAAVSRALDLSNRLEARDPGELGGFLTATIFLHFRDLGRLPELGARDLGQLEQAILDNSRSEPSVPGWRAGLAWLHALQGRTAEAREGFEQLVAVGFDRIPFNDSWPPTMAILTELTACLEAPDQAEELRASLLGYADWFAVIPTGLGCLGSLRHSLGRLSGVLGDWKEADDHYQQALLAHRRIGSPPLAARTQHEHGRMLLRLAPAAEHERGHTLLAAAQQTARRLGMAPLSADAGTQAVTRKRRRNNPVLR